jgi:hypothetical protein
MKNHPFADLSPKLAQLRMQGLLPWTAATTPQLIYELANFNLIEDVALNLDQATLIYINIIFIIK